MSQVLATQARPTEFIRLAWDPMAPYAARITKAGRGFEFRFLCEVAESDVG